MIAKYDCNTLAGKNILDPTCGSGNLLIACLIAGADLDKLYGNEYDARVIPTCRKRILRAAEILGLDTSKFNDWQIHQGNALQARCLLEFGPSYSGEFYESTTRYKPRYNPEYIDDLDYAQSYDHEETIEEDFGVLGKQTSIKVYKALSWDTENRRASERANKQRALEEKKSIRPAPQPELYSLF